jgi:ERCC4-type nuclease
VSMIIRVDTREDALHGMFKLNSAHQLRSEPLPVGDVILSSADGQTDYIVFERKTLLDLAASILDGRYKEQSHRLQAIPNVHCHNVVYIIEGDLARYNERFSKISKKALYSAMCSLNYYKGFSVVRTMSIMETHELIQHYADKLAASPAPYGKYYTPESSAAHEAATTAATTIASTIASTTTSATATTTASATTTAAAEEPSYCSVLKVKQVKCENITPQNIGEIMLCNIPGVSNKTAAVIVKKYPTLRALIEAFKMCGSSDCLNDIRLETQRKLSKQCIQNIYNFLMT